MNIMEELCTVKAEDEYIKKEEKPAESFQRNALNRDKNKIYTVEEKTFPIKDGEDFVKEEDLDCFRDICEEDSETTKKSCLIKNELIKEDLVKEELDCFNDYYKDSEAIKKERQCLANGEKERNIGTLCSAEKDSTSPEGKKKIISRSCMDEARYRKTPDQCVAIRGQIIDYHKAGHGIRSTSRLLGVPTATVSKWIRRYKEEGRLLDRYGGGRRRDTTTDQDQAIAQCSTKHPTMTAIQVKESLNLTVSACTVRRRLYSSGRYKQDASRTHKLLPTRKPELNERQRLQRLEFANRYSNEDLEFWKRVIFTNVLRVQNICKTQKSRRLTGTMWGWFSYYGPGELISIDGNLTSEDYISILEDVLVPSVRAMALPEPLSVYVVHDQSPIHRCHLVQKWKKNHPDINFLDWPSKGADLNPIEDLWGTMVQEWNSHQKVNCQDELFASTLQIWEGLRRTPLIYENLVASMPQRLQSCIENNGYYTKY